jgi:transgelin
MLLAEYERRLLAERAAARRDAQQVALRSCRAWAQQVAGVEFAPDSTLQAELKSGVVLCHLANKIKSGVCREPSISTSPAKQMENVSNYLLACDVLGVPKHEQFKAEALFEDKHLTNKLLTNLHALARVTQRVSGVHGPAFGGKLPGAHLRALTEPGITVMAC